MNAVFSRTPLLSQIPSLARLRFDPFHPGTRTSLYDQIGQSIGDDAADKLIADFGGRRLYIPVTPAAGDLVSDSIGLPAAKAMARTFGGDRLLIPVTSNRARRRVRILKMRADHVSISRIAHELRCTERYVYKVLALDRARKAAGKETIPPTTAPTDGRSKRGATKQRS